MKRTAIIGAFGGALLALSSAAQAHVNVDIGIGVPSYRLRRTCTGLCGSASVRCDTASLRPPPGGRGSCSRLCPILAGTR